MSSMRRSVGWEECVHVDDGDIDGGVEGMRK
jgi:hypothetical protein